MNKNSKLMNKNSKMMNKNSKMMNENGVFGKFEPILISC